MTRRGHRGRDAGMVSAELALAFPAVVLLLALALTGLTFAVDLVRCEDAARAAARAASRGDTISTVEGIVRSRAPLGSQLSVVRDAESVLVEVQAPRRGKLLRILPVAVGEAEARWEPGARP